MSYKIIDLPALGRQFNSTDIIEVSANGTGSYKANIGNYTLGGTNYIFVNANGTPAQNGAAVRTAYTAAQALTPNGVAKSATNRVIILLSPGYYSFNEATLGAFQINQSFIDFESLSGNKDVYFSSIQIKSTGLGINVIVSGIDTTKNNYYTHAAFNIASAAGANEYISVTNCKGGDYSFSSFSSGFKGVYNNCEALQYSFGCAGNAVSPPPGIVSSYTGNFENYGYITNCIATDYSFCTAAIVGVASGVYNYNTIENCIGGVNCFCFSFFRAQNNAIIQRCYAESDSFLFVNDGVGAGLVNNGGKIIDCYCAWNGFLFYDGANTSSLAAQNTGVLLRNYSDYFGCVYNSNNDTGTNTGFISNCQTLGSGFCGINGNNSGKIIDCYADNSGFCADVPLNITGPIIRCTMLNYTFNVGTTGVGGKVVLGIDTTGVVNY